MHFKFYKSIAWVVDTLPLLATVASYDRSLQLVVAGFRVDTLASYLY